jgi:hypothetical protein
MSKNVLVLLVSGIQGQRPRTRKVPRGYNTHKTLHSRCQSASRASTRAHAKFDKMVNRAIPGFTTVILEDGGDRRDRTDDLKLAKLPLYQLSYVPPTSLPADANDAADWRCNMARQPKLRRSEGWWAWEDLNFRPHAYQARALTN